jgi:ABC-2 type transport system permease protein
MNHLPLIIKREYLTKVKNKSFILMTFVSPLIMVALFAVVAYLSQLNNDKERTIAVLDETGVLSDVFANTEYTTYTILTDTNLETAKELTKAKEDFGLLYIEKSSDTINMFSSVQFFSDESPSVGIMNSLEEKIEKKLEDTKLIKNGVDIEQIEASI